VGQLQPGGRLLLWAMRRWIHAASQKTCPPGALAPAFARHGVLPALPHVHALLTELNCQARRRINLAPLAHHLIGDDEAVLLQLCRDANLTPPRAKATLALLLDEEAIGAAFNALLIMVARLRDAGLGDVTIVPDGIAGAV
ncbi:MAG TPA: hypothetical protein VKQ27_04515, partial [Acetobacteraceae bacterium]|nr:hypothetical protein [Acetobacteraceae bacterium]